MNYSNEAEQVVKIVLDGSEWALKLTGSGLEHLIPMISAALRGEKQTKGKARLETLIRSGKPLKAFAVKDEQLELFTKEAKKYGVMYTALKDEKGGSGWTDVLAKVDDAGMINRIFERFKLMTADPEALEREILKEKAEKTKDPVDRNLEEVLSAKEKNAQDPKDGAQRSRQSESSFGRTETIPSVPSEEERRPSVKAEMKKIEAAKKAEESMPRKQPIKSNAHINVPKKKRKAGKERA